MSIAVTLNGTINVTDTITGTQALQKVLTALLTTGTSYIETSGGSAGTSPVSLTLPVSPATFVYIKNLHGTQTLAVTWTPNGGSSNPAITLQPGSYIVFGEAILGLSGITAVTVTGSGAGTTYESILAG